MGHLDKKIIQNSVLKIQNFKGQPLTRKDRIKVFDVPMRRAAWCEVCAYACSDEARNSSRLESSASAGEALPGKG